MIQILENCTSTLQFQCIIRLYKKKHCRNKYNFNVISITMFSPHTDYRAQASNNYNVSFIGRRL